MTPTNPSRYSSRNNSSHGSYPLRSSNSSSIPISSRMGASTLTSERASKTSAVFKREIPALNQLLPSHSFHVGMQVRYNYGYPCQPICDLFEVAAIEKEKLILSNKGGWLAVPMDDQNVQPWASFVYNSPVLVQKGEKYAFGHMVCLDYDQAMIGQPPDEQKPLMKISLSEGDPYNLNCPVPSFPREYIWPIEKGKEESIRKLLSSFSSQGGLSDLSASRPTDQKEERGAKPPGKPPVHQKEGGAAELTGRAKPPYRKKKELEELTKQWFNRYGIQEPPHSGAPS